MITELDEAIIHCKEKAKINREIGEMSLYKGSAQSVSCLECAKDHEQLAEWLTELAERREADRWISVSERLPEGMGTYLVTLEYKEHGKGVTTLWYHGKQIGWDLRVADVVTAWKPLPKPYESEEEK